MATSFRLSNEELALVCALLGKPGFACVFLGLEPGENVLENEVEHARLLTAGHGLMARYALSVGADGSINISETLAHIGQVITEAAYTLEFSKSDELGDWHIAFHSYHDEFWQHITDMGVVHEIWRLDDKQQIIDSAIDFFSLPQPEEESEGQGFTSEMPLNVFQQMLTLTSQGEVVQILEETRWPQDIANTFASDLLHPALKGGVFRNQYDDGLLASSCGCFLVKGSSRYWLVEVPISNGNQTDRVVVRSFSWDIFKRLFSEWNLGRM